jgi:PKD repeat protein
MKKFSVIFVLFLCVIFLTCVQADNPKHIKMMKDKKVNFFEVQKEFNKYFKDKDKGRGTGWKPFKRWEYFWGQRLYPSGERANLADPVQEMAEFNAQYPSAASVTWVELGPNTFQNNTGSWNPGIGRINDIVLDPNDSNTIYIGTPSGGLWRSTTGGNSWTALTQTIEAIGVSCILIDPTDSNVIYIGTGDRDAYDCWSRGILKTTDGGATWNTTGMSFVPTQWQQIKKMLMHPTNNQVIWAATYLGLYKTTDGAASWTLILDGDVDDLEFKPGDNSIMYAVTNNVPSPIFYRSVDGGNSFTQGSMSSSARAQIAVTPANPEYVYYFSKDQGVQRSEDSGVTWNRKGRAPTAGTQDWYDLAIAVSPVNAEEVHVGELESFVSTNGGKRFTKTSIWSYPNNTGYVHSDIHEMVYFGSTLYVGSDGMITKSNDSGTSWIDLSGNLAIRQFYRIASGVNGNPYKLAGGSQDNGTSVYSTDHWHDWLGADGMECVIDYSNENIIYGCIQNGSFYKSTDGGNNRVNIVQPGSGDWVTPYVIDPLNPSTLYVGNASVRKTTNGMGSWSTIGSFGTGNINALAIAKSNPDYIYAAKDDLIWRTIDGGNNWTEITGTLPGYFITYISVHPTNPEKVAVTLSSFWTYADGEKVFTSTNAGTTWANYSANLPNLPANCIVYAGGDNDAMYVGMDVGLYYRDTSMSDWLNYSGNMPNVIINELEIDTNINKIRACTFGRGLWEADLYSTGPTGPPVANFSADQTSVYEGDSVSYTDLSTNSPTSWSWSFSGGSPATSSDQHPVVTYNSSGTYDVSLIATNSSGSDTLVKTGYITVSQVPQLPTYCASSGTTFSTEWVAGVAIGNFSNSSGAAGYSDFTSQVMQLTAGASVSVTLTPGKATGKPQTEFWKIWIDVNADGDFDDAGEEVFSSTAKNSSAVTGSFTVPSGVVYTGLRVAMKRDAYPTTCETFAYGEVEDYAIDIVASGLASSSGIVRNSPYKLFLDDSNGNLIIKHQSHSGSLNIRILDTYGKMVKKIIHNGGKVKHVSVMDLASGNYSALISDGKREVKNNFVKK